MAHKMTKEEFIIFMEEQKKEIDISKYIESKKVGYDLGNEYVLLWIKKYAAQFAKEWNKLHDIED